MAHGNAEYRVLEATEVTILEKKVTRAIAENWLPQGGVMIVNLGDGDLLYAQAMTFCVEVAE